MRMKKTKQTKRQQSASERPVRLFNYLISIDSFAWPSSVEHPPMIVNGTKDPLRSILRRGQRQNQLLLSGGVPDGIPRNLFVQSSRRSWVRAILEPRAN